MRSLRNEEQARPSLVALCVCIVSGSDFAFGQKLYPVQGPLTAQTPQPVFSGQIQAARVFGGTFVLATEILDRCQWRSALSSAAQPCLRLGCRVWAGIFRGEDSGQKVWAGYPSRVLDLAKWDGA